MMKMIGTKISGKNVTLDMELDIMKLIDDYNFTDEEAEKAINMIDKDEIERNHFTEDRCIGQN